ncbi:Plant lipid transfer protein/Par allergen [Corchorus olitorius]|uniref:Non-specific lipid-transfer protein n=1 Tax=Corchorus olitorius TaxID=93759 RepID=A0A1R3JHR6_9ROSI|nr:Plant lipid transfer protein/Par allergen [Corchorus olitorius]
MAAPNLSLKLVCVVAMLCMLFVYPRATAALSCGDVQSNLFPCLEYLKSSGEDNKDECCGGVRSLNNIARTPTARRDACNCIKRELSRLGVADDSTKTKLAQALPKTCNVNIPYKISLDTDCSK